MNVLIVYAHPEPRSLNGSLKSFMVEHLQAAGHAVQVSDLYAMKWKALLDQEDFADREPGARFDPGLVSQRAFENGRQSADVAEEQRKLLWADVVIFQFPLWWFSMPAILKGWVDCVFARGFAYGVGEFSGKHWGNRYGEGVMTGKRAMVLVTTGGADSNYGPRGVNGPIDDLLFPIQHGILYYAGFTVLPPFTVFRTSKVDEAMYARVRERLAARLDALTTAEPIAFRSQNGGDYEIPSLELKDVHAPGATGFGVHVAPGPRGG